MEWKINDNDLMLLDGICSPEAQALVDCLKIRLGMESNGLTEMEAKFIQDLLAVAKKDGKLLHRPSSAKYCDVCKTSKGYYPHRRSGRYHRKGDPDHRRPILLDGYEFKDAFVRMENYWSLGCCGTCYTKLKPYIRTAISEFLKTSKAEIPEVLREPDSTAFQRVSICRCKKCGWEGPETEMGKEQTFMGDGYYPAKCPKCDGANRLFGPLDIETVSGKYHYVEQVAG